MRPAAIIGPVLALAGCLEPAVPLGGGGAAGERALVVEIPPVTYHEVDLLFVVDNSEDADDTQQALEYSFERLRNHLKFAQGGLPDLHLGVISTDLGVGDNPVAGCTAAGDEGRLRHEGRAGCPGPEGRFIRDYRAGDTRDTNYDGELVEAFDCISQLGTGGCRFEQPLEAMRRALDPGNAYNDGFLRAGAILAVVFLTNDDDCSVSDSHMFAPELEGNGEVRKYRCFKYGVQCVGDDVREEGHFEGCEPRRESPYMPHVKAYADFLLDPTPSGLGKPDPHRQVVVSGMIGDAALGEVEIHLDGDGEPQLVPACELSDDAIYPAVRLQSFLDRFVSGGTVSSLCRSEPHNALTQTGREIRKRLGTICLDGPVSDVDPEEPGRQVDCEVLLRYADPAAPKRELAACDEPWMPGSSTESPCYTIKTGPAACGDFTTQLALDVYWGPGESQPADVHVEGWCLVDTE